MDVQRLLEVAVEHFNNERHLIPMYLHLLVSALFPIYAGAHASLSRPASAAEPVRKNQPAHGEEEEEEEVQKMEGMSPRDAVIYPLIAGITLAGLYYLITKYGAKAINLIFGWYFAIAGVFSVAKLMSDAATVAIGFAFPTYFGRNGKLYKVDEKKRKAIPQYAGDAESWDMPVPFVPAWSKIFCNVARAVRAAIKQRYTVEIRDNRKFIDEKTNLTIVHVVSAVLGVAASLYANLVAKPWYLTNLQGFAVCYTAFQMLSPTTFTTGSLLLGGLFCYDIWAVFFTPLMVTVAKNLDQPIKLVFPRPEEVVQPQQIPFLPHKLSEVTGETPRQNYSMLGLGDIVLPGIMIALALRFDLHMYYLKKQRKLTRKAITADGEPEREEEVTERACYVPVTGNFGNRFWTARLPALARPEKLNASFPKPYFYASMFGYIVGLLTTLGVMSVYQHAQPALLYLVPGVLVSLWGTALVRSEVKQMWAFSEAVDAEPNNDRDVKDEKKVDNTPATWLDTWHEVLCLLGLRERKLEAQGADTVPSETSATDRKVESSQDERKKAGSQDSDVLFNFTIRRYTPGANSKRSSIPDGSSDASDRSGSPEKPFRSQAGSESSNEDAVLVEAHDT